MKRTVVHSLLVLAALIAGERGALADGGQLTPGGLTKVTHGAEMSGNGTTTSSLVFTPCGSANQAYVWNGSAFICTTVGSGTGTVTNVATGTGLTGGPITTTGTISLANTAVGAGSYTLGNFTVDAQGRLGAASSYGGSGSVADKAITALSGAGVATFQYFYDSPGTGLATGATGNIVKLADTAVTPGSYTYASATVNQQGQITAMSSGATPALASTTISAGTMLSGGGDLSTNRTIALADIATDTVIGRVAAGTGAPSALSAAQLTTLVQPFSATLSGAVPASGGGTTTYLRADGTFATPPGTGVTSVATGTGLTGGTITTTGTLSLYINGGVTQTCGAGTAVTAVTGVGLTSCTAFGSSSLTNSAGSNVIPKSNGTNLVASSVSDNGTTVSTSEAVSTGALSVTGTVSTTGNATIGTTATAGGTNSLIVENTSNAASTTTDIALRDGNGDLFRISSDNAGLVTTLKSVNRNTVLGFWTGSSGGAEAMRLNADGTMNMDSHQIHSVANASVSSDAAAFGQIGTAVNAAVSGTTGRVGVFSGTNSLTGYAGFTSDSSGNVTVANFAANGTSALNGTVTVTAANGLYSQDSASPTAAARLVAAGGASYLQSGTSSASSAAALNFTSMNGLVAYGSFDSSGNFTANHAAHIVGALTEDGNTTLGSSASNTHTINGAISNVLSSTNTTLGSTADALQLINASNTTNDLYEIMFEDHVASLTSEIAGKTVDQTNHYGAIQIATRGPDGYNERLDIASTGVTTMLGQGLAVNGLYQGQAQDVADVMQSGVIRKNLVNHTDELGNNGDLSQSQATTGTNNGWGAVNGTATMAYATSTAVAAPWFPSTITPKAGTIGKITCTGASCTSSGAAWVSVETSTNTGIFDLRSLTLTLSVWIQASIGTMSTVAIGLGRYNDNDAGTTTCPSTTAGTWVRCSYTRTFSATSLTDNSELRMYIYPESTTALYVAGAQPEQGSMPTPYQPNDATMGGSGFGLWAEQVRIGNTSGNPRAWVGTDGSASLQAVTAASVFIPGGAKLTGTGDLEFEYDLNTTGLGRINFDGYNGGVTEFRDLAIYDGEEHQVAYFTGVTKAVEFNGVATFDNGIVSTAASNSLAATTFSGAVTFNSGVSGQSEGTITLSSGSGTATVRSGAVCVCSDTTAENVCSPSVSTTTLTVKGIGSDVIAYHCF